MRNILLTGASGLLGSTLLPLLTGHEVTALTHRAGVAATTVHGDLTRPLLGMDRGDHRELARRVETVVHCAATVDFGIPAERVMQINLGGTLQVIDFCRRAGAELLYVSTAFVSRRGLALRATETGIGSPVAYIESKLAAEAAVRGSGIPTAIVRPSVICGDAITGAVPKYQGFHQHIADWISGQTGIVPMAPGTGIDLIPVDTVAHALAALLARPLADADYWLTSGTAQLTIARLVELTMLAAESSGMPHDHLTVVPASLAPAALERDPSAVHHMARHRFESLTHIAAAFEDAPPFPTSLGSIPGGPTALTPDEVERVALAGVNHVLGNIKKERTLAGVG